MIYIYIISIFYIILYAYLQNLSDSSGIKPQERPTSPLSSDWSTWKGQGAPAVEPMIHQLSMGWVNIQATVLRPSFHIISSSQIQICNVYIIIYIYVISAHTLGYSGYRMMFHIYQPSSFVDHSMLGLLLLMNYFTSRDLSWANYCQLLFSCCCT